MMDEHIKAWVRELRRRCVANVGPLASAWKRAKHFGVPYDGPFTCLKSAVGSNYALLIDSGPANDVDEILIFLAWAMALNRLADQYRVSERLDLCEAFASFRSRLWFDPVKLMA